ncbi:MAG: hypothetical protein Q9192_009018, partial [Flavoplaca navasiana]
GTLAGDLFWQLEETLKGTEPGDEYGVQYSKEAGSVYDEVVTTHTRNMKEKPVGGA